jgi:hypothetical protein
MYNCTRQVPLAVYRITPLLHTISDNKHRGTLQTMCLAFRGGKVNFKSPQTTNLQILGLPLEINRTSSNPQIFRCACPQIAERQVRHTLYTLTFIMKILHYVFNGMYRSSACGVPLDCYSTEFCRTISLLAGNVR